MLEKHILVPMLASGKNFRSLHYALALAERLEAHVHILHDPAEPSRPMSRESWLDAALSDLIDAARRAGRHISRHVGSGRWKEEIVDLVSTEGIDLVVFGEEEAWDPLVLRLKTLVPPHIIHVKPKNHYSNPAKEDDPP